MTEAMPFLQNYDITFLRPPPIPCGLYPGFSGAGGGRQYGRLHHPHRRVLSYRLLPVSQKKQDRNNACGRRRARLPRLQGVLSAESGRRGAAGACLRGERTGGQYAVSVSVGFPDADSRTNACPHSDTGSNADAGPCGQGVRRGKRAVLGRRRCGRYGGRLHAFRRCQTPLRQGGEKVIKSNKMAGCKRIRPFL